jgi:hypothetical protein
MDGQSNDQKKNSKGQTMINKSLHRKVGIEQHEPYEKPGVN